MWHLVALRGANAFVGSEVETFRLIECHNGVTEGWRQTQMSSAWLMQESICIFFFYPQSIYLHAFFGGALMAVFVFDVLGKIPRLIGKISAKLY